MYMKTAKSANVGRLATRGRSAVGNPSSYYPSPGWLRIDPNFAPLKGNPRFERLVAGK